MSENPISCGLKPELPWASWRENPTLLCLSPISCGLKPGLPWASWRENPTLLCLSPIAWSVHSGLWQELPRACLSENPISCGQGCPGLAGEKTPLCSVSHPSLPWASWGENPTLLCLSHISCGLKPGLPWASWRENPTFLCLPPKAWSVRSAPCGLPPGLSRAIWRKIAIHSSSACHWSPVTGS